METKEAVQAIKDANEGYKNDVISKAKEEVAVAKTVADEAKAETAIVKGDVETLKAKVITIDEAYSAMQAKAARLHANGGLRTTKAISDFVGENIMKNEAFFKGLQSDGAMKDEGLVMKATAVAMTSATLSGQAYGSYLPWQPGMEPIGYMPHFRDLVTVIGSDTDTVYYPRANAVVSGNGNSFGLQVTEGSVKSQVDRTYTMITLNLLTMAGYTIASRQSLRNIKFLSTWLPTSLNEQLQDTEDAYWRDQLFATISTTSTAGLVPADAIIRLIRTIMQRKYRPNGIVVDPVLWERLVTYKGSGSGEYTMPLSGIQGMGARGPMSFLGIPLYSAIWLASNQAIVGDWSSIAIVESEGLTLRQDMINDQFIRNQVTFLLERVEGLALFRTDALTYTTVP